MTSLHAERYFHSKIYRSSTGLIQQTVQIAASRDLTLFVSASNFNSSKELIEAKEATMAFFMKEYKNMLEENMDDYILNFSKYLKPRN